MYSDFQKNSSMKVIQIGVKNKTINGNEFSDVIPTDRCRKWVE